jgi:hypothetical protein
MKEYAAWPAKLKDRIFKVDALVFLVLLAFIPMFLHWKPKKDDGSDSTQADDKKAAFFAVLLVLGILYLRNKDFFHG